MSNLIAGLEAHLRERGRSPRTIDTYSRALHMMDRQLPMGLEVANETELKAWIWRQGIRPATRSVYLAALFAFFRWSVDHAEILTFDPTRRMEAPKIGRRLPRVASDEQVRELLTRSRNPYRLWAVLASYAGLRCIEVHRLHREHVTQAKLIVQRGKGEVPRQLPTHPLIWEAVEPMPSGPLVTEAATEIYLSRNFGEYCRRTLGMKDMSMHRLRGWWATHTYRLTKDIRAVQHGMGHANPGTTAGYIDVSDTQLQAAVEMLPTFD